MPLLADFWDQPNFHAKWLVPSGGSWSLLLEGPFYHKSSFQGSVSKQGCLTPIWLCPHGSVASCPKKLQSQALKLPTLFPCLCSHFDLPYTKIVLFSHRTYQRWQTMVGSLFSLKLVGTLPWSRRGTWLDQQDLMTDRSPRGNRITDHKLRRLRRLSIGWVGGAFLLGTMGKSSLDLVACGTGAVSQFLEHRGCSRVWDFQNECQEAHQRQSNKAVPTYKLYITQPPCPTPSYLQALHPTNLHALLHPAHRSYTHHRSHSALPA